MNCPAPTQTQPESQSLLILLAVIVFPEINTQHPSHKIISGVLFPVSVVKVKDSACEIEEEILYPSNWIII